MGKKIELVLPDKVKILGISGAHRPGWNTDFILKEALKSAEQLGPWVETEMVQLWDYKIGPCKSCFRCYMEATDDLICPGQADDMDKAGIYHKVLEADALLVSTCVYWGSMSGITKDFIDRTLPFCHGSSSKFSGAMSLKVAAALAVGLDTHGGQEMTCQDLHAWMFTQDMIVVGAGYHHPHGGYVGGMACTQIGVPSFGRDSAKFDAFGMRTVYGTGKKVAETALFVKVARAALQEWGEELLPKYQEGSIQIDWEKFYSQNSHLTREHVGVPGRIGTSKGAFENWLKIMAARGEGEYEKGLVFGRGLKNPELIRTAWLEHHKAVLISDEQLYRLSPWYYGQYVKK